jgi:membrane-anchored mycosin MYCP
MSLVAAAAIVTALVGLPPGATAPPPGSIPHGATVQVLDRQLGIVAIDLRRRSASQALVRLRLAPGVRYATVASGGGGFAATTPNCPAADTPVPLGKTSAGWRTTIRLSKHSAGGFTVGIPDTGADLSRLGGTRDRLATKDFFSRTGTGVADEVDHGTEIASLLAASRPDLGITGVAPDVGLAIARIAKLKACDPATLSSKLIEAFAWFRKIGDVQIVNVSLTLKPTPGLIESLRALQESGTLVVAATGNSKNPGEATFPAAEPHVLGVGALQGSSRSVWTNSGRGPQVDLVAPSGGAGVVYSSLTSRSQQAGETPEGTSFATPIVSGAAALVWAKHSAWDASRVASALMLSAKHLSGARPNTTSGYGRLDVKAALGATPPADLSEPNDWASAAAGLTPLAHKATLAATVGGGNDPLDAYPFSTKGKSVITVRGAGVLQGYLLRSGRLSAIERPVAKLKVSATRSAAGRTLHLRVPGKGRWYLVVAAQGATAAAGYTVRVP